MAKKSFKSLLEKARQRDAYRVAKAIQDFTEDLFRLMEGRDVTKAELARRIGKSPAYVTKVFRGNSNFTIDSMVKLAHALDGQLCIRVGRKENQGAEEVIPSARSHDPRRSFVLPPQPDHPSPRTRARVVR